MKQIKLEIRTISVYQWFGFRVKYFPNRPELAQQNRISKHIWNITNFRNLFSFISLQTFLALHRNGINCVADVHHLKLYLVQHHWIQTPAIFSQSRQPDIQCYHANNRHLPRNVRVPWPLPPRSFPTTVRIYFAKVIPSKNTNIAKSIWMVRCPRKSINASHCPKTIGKFTRKM